MSWPSDGEESPYEDRYDTVDVLEPTAETSSLLAQLTGLTSSESSSSMVRATRAPNCMVLLLDTEGDIVSFSEDRCHGMSLTTVPRRVQLRVDSGGSERWLGRRESTTEQT